MPLIEGVGDEVVQFLGVVLVVMVGALAWFSTNARPDRYRTVLVMRSRPHHPVTLSIRTRSNLMVTSSSTSSSTPASTPADTGTASTSAPGEESRESARVIPLQEMDSIVDADMAMLDHNRLHFYRRMDSGNSTQTTTETSIEESESQEQVEPANNAQIREMDSIVSAMEAEVTTGCDFFARPTESSTEPSKPDSITVNNNKNNSETSESNSKPEETGDLNSASGDQGTSSDDIEGASRRKILIKLKFLNDTLKEVEGCLDELLKDFKLRHFSLELSARARVRLIFHGRVLADEAATLRALGLHHRAVVHCLVHPTATPTPTPTLAGAGAAPVPLAELVSAPPPERDWDLENILMTLVSVALTVVWFFRCEYSNMFTASASVALFGLTVFYSVAIFGLYLNDTFHFDRRPAQAQPIPDN